MRINKVYIKNFHSIKELEFTFPESRLMVLVGANNAGKSKKGCSQMLTWALKQIDTRLMNERDQRER